MSATTLNDRASRFLQEVLSSPEQVDDVCVQEQQQVAEQTQPVVHAHGDFGHGDFGHADR